MRVIKNFRVLSQKLWRNRKGVTALEFGLLAPVFFLLFLGLIEVCFVMTKIVLAENAIRIAGRTAIVSTNTDVQIKNIITRNTFGFVNFAQPGNCVIISAFSTVTEYKKRTPNTDCNGKNTGDVGVSMPDAIIVYELFAEHRFFTPLGALMNMAARTVGNENFKSIKFSTSTIVKNEPFDASGTTTPAP